MLPLQKIAPFLVADAVLVMYFHPFTTPWLARLHAFLLGAVLCYSLQLLQQFTGMSTLLVAFSHFFLLVQLEFGQSVFFSWQADSSNPLSSIDVRLFSREAAEDLIYASLPSLFYLGAFFKRHYCLISPANFYFCIASVLMYLVVRSVDVTYLAFSTILQVRIVLAGMVTLSIVLMVASITSPFLKLYWVVLFCSLLGASLEVIDAISKSADVMAASYISDILLPQTLKFLSAAIIFWVSEMASDFNQCVRNSRARKRVCAAAERGVVFQWMKNHSEDGVY